MSDTRSGLKTSDARSLACRTASRVQSQRREQEGEEPDGEDVHTAQRLAGGLN